MSEQPVGTSDPREQYAPLAQWLHQLLATSNQATHTEQIPIGEDVNLASTDYHAEFYPQIPNFAMALLKHETDATLHFAPLLFHLISCPTCHRAYLEIYDALHVALDSTARLAPPPRIPASISLATTSPKLLVFLCQLMIAQARAILLQAHREHADQDAWVRTLLQQAMQFSQHIMQDTLRQRALRDLVAVASLYATTAPEMTTTPTGPATLSYGVLVSNGSSTRGRTLRRADTLSRSSDQPISIDLRSDTLEGSISQQDDLLILHLSDLDPALYGKMLLISVPLGTLIEPVRWLGGNPYAIHSSVPVSTDGTLNTPVGRTDLHLYDPEEHNLIETLFKKLEIRSLT